MRIGFDDFLEDDLQASLHELVRNNVMVATRYLNHRLKAFIRTVIMARSNPMSVKFYSYKIEFQERGAAHAHGVIWLDLQRLENLERGRKGCDVFEHTHLQARPLLNI